jgi:hypothetical protein
VRGRGEERNWGAGGWEKEDGPGYGRDDVARCYIYISKHFLPMDYALNSFFFEGTELILYVPKKLILYFKTLFYRWIMGH